mmetsp:Transcript_10572/g.9321  ORF Transcript_10572/g.9321 Transcript_10572/m.9321 type:complete len:126 (+) Transcript_10572:159-536(+)
MKNNFMERQKKAKISWKRSILSAIESFKDYKLASVDEYKTLVPQDPLSHTFAQQYMDYVKNNDYFSIKLLLESNPNLVYEFDERYQTGLHWACKRGYSKILSLLIQLGANINIKDVSGRTPLWLA